MCLVVGLALLEALVVFPSHPFHLHHNGMIDHVAESLVVTSGHNLPDPMM